MRPAPLPTLATPLNRRRSRQRRFLVLAAAGLAVLGVTMGVSFLANSGSVSASVSPAAGSANFVHTVADGATMVAGANFVNQLKYTPTTSFSVSNADQVTAPSAAGSTIKTALGSAKLPSWSPTANSAGSVTTAGDLALIDTTGATNSVVVNMFVTNLAALQLDYSSFALPVNVYGADCTSGSCTWAADTTLLPTAVFITNTDGFLTFNLPSINGTATDKKRYFDITIETGGSFYTISTNAAGGALGPSFYFTAQPT